jgi:hypothetical protein
MALTLADHRKILSGFEPAGYMCAKVVNGAINPIHIRWQTSAGPREYRLWVFEITHGGGGSEVRAADEFRIQITNGPNSVGDLDAGGATDLLLGYSRDRDAIVAYDRRWLESYIEKTASGSRGSPSVQVKDADLQAGHQKGVHWLTKKSQIFGIANIVTMNPAMLPTYLLDHVSILQGASMPTLPAGSSTSASGSTVADYCFSQGFPFEADLLARYIASFLSKPFVILAGVSGTGKSKLAELVAEFYTREGAPSSAAHTPTTGDAYEFVSAKGGPDPLRFALVAVRPDWIDNQAIFGFLNPITGGYESTQALDLILRASAASARHFLLLDEMNLARVEHYFSDWLACTESRRLTANGSITQRPVALHRHPQPLSITLETATGLAQSIMVPKSLMLPTNLVVTGTVNVDETTYGFSPKVLDRAMVIEFDDVDLDSLRSGPSTNAASQGYRLPIDLPGFRLATRLDYAALPESVHEHLVAINGILETARLHIGYRAANEIALFMRLYSDMLPVAEAEPTLRRALDIAILQKVLPRLAGNRAKMETPLAKLCLYLRDLSLPSTLPDVIDFDTAALALLPKSYTRATEMYEALRSFGFVSFFK